MASKSPVTTALAPFWYILAGAALGFTALPLVVAIIVARSLRGVLPAKVATLLLLKGGEDQPKSIANVASKIDGAKVVADIPGSTEAKGE